ncbi:MAG TPA: hypothetical protein VKR58_11165, partial [Aquella sp.]|nr:hypothetical protein [Aquella sp.]
IFFTIVMIFTNCAKQPIRVCGVRGGSILLVPISGDSAEKLSNTKLTNVTFSSYVVEDSIPIRKPY